MDRDVYQLVPLGFGRRVNCRSVADACVALARQSTGSYDYEDKGDHYEIFDVYSGRTRAVCYFRRWH